MSESDLAVGKREISLRAENLVLRFGGAAVQFALRAPRVLLTKEYFSLQFARRCVFTRPRPEADIHRMQLGEMLGNRCIAFSVA